MTDNEPAILKLNQLVAMALVAATAIAIPYAYLLWDEARDHGEPFWHPNVIVLLGAPFIGFGAAALLIWLSGRRLPQKVFFSWALIAFAGSFIALVAVLIYFYFTDGLNLTWKRQLWNFGLTWLGVGAYSSLFTAIYYYTLIRRRPT